MKVITPPLVKFTCTILLLSIGFRSMLAYTLIHQMYTVVIITVIIYMLLMFASGCYFGKKDAMYLPIMDIGFRSHLITYIVCNGVGEFWYAFHLNAPTDSIHNLRITELIWGIFLAIHFVFFLFNRNNAIRNLDKRDLFD